MYSTKIGAEKNPIFNLMTIISSSSSLTASSSTSWELWGQECIRIPLELSPSKSSSQPPPSLPAFSTLVNACSLSLLHNRLAVVPLARLFSQSRHARVCQIFIAVEQLRSPCPPSTALAHHIAKILAKNLKPQHASVRSLQLTSAPPPKSWDIVAIL